MNTSLGKYMFKVNNKKTTTSADVFVVSLLLTLNNRITPVRFGLLAWKIHDKYMPKVKDKGRSVWDLFKNDIKTQNDTSQVALSQSVVTYRRFNVYKTSIQRRRRRIDVL